MSDQLLPASRTAKIEKCARQLPRRFHTHPLAAWKCMSPLHEWMARMDDLLMNFCMVLPPAADLCGVGMCSFYDLHQRPVGRQRHPRVHLLDLPHHEHHRQRPDAGRCRHEQHGPQHPGRPHSTPYWLHPPSLLVPGWNIGPIHAHPSLARVGRLSGVLRSFLHSG